MTRRIAIVVLGLVATVWLPAPAGAVWAASTAGSGQAQSTAPAPPGTTTASCGLLLDASIKVDWAPSPSPWVTQYEVRWGTNAGAPNQTNIVTGTTFTTPNLGLGTWYFTVRSVKGSWRSTPSNQVSKGIITILFVAVCA